MSNISLTLGCWDYDRVQPLIDGRVRPAGIDLTFLNMIVEETFFRMLRNHEFDACEMSMSSYTVSLTRPDRPFVAIPVFPSRFFRHSCIYVNAAAGIEKPEDLIGKRIGVPEYQMTAPVWIRGILQDYHNVPVDSVTYVTGGEETPNRDEKLKLDLPDRIRIERIGPTDTLAQMLADGRIDALHTARKPSTFDGQKVKRLFPDFVPVEQAYWRDTGIFPIMHVIAIRRDVYEANRWVAMNLFKAFREAQALCYEGLQETAALKGMLPWFNAHVEETLAMMGPDFWPYGLDKNRDTLETFLRYHHEQGLSPRKLEVEEMFAPEVLEEFVI
ncbi:ABC transporter substrate-binding protein [Puniceibacterium sp. IMCC21224]|uniref:ABC transporter substrate-binding protein n=1 Tax=Puniceibacterium sp. IMCC21224 TaxID=1618204 RepID=UPI00064D8342|nr:ABC transporter substrate-binding protein [Puniceibacterium sp. IMCC21224]KMK65020.1 4,5-dihydroxyphthalate decarboxylase [Puniceibacterium sp. IMCC21224]